MKTLSNLSSVSRRGVGAASALAVAGSLVIGASPANASTSVNTDYVNSLRIANAARDLSKIMEVDIAKLDALLAQDIKIQTALEQELASSSSSGTSSTAPTATTTSTSTSSGSATTNTTGSSGWDWCGTNAAKVDGTFWGKDFFPFSPYFDSRGFLDLSAHFKADASGCSSTNTAPTTSSTTNTNPCVGNSTPTTTSTTANATSYTQSQNQKWFGTGGNTQFKSQSWHNDPNRTNNSNWSQTNYSRSQNNSNGWR